VDDDVLSEWLSDPTVVPVLLQRPFLPTYVSWLKAKLTDEWARRDTTDLRVEVDVDDYLEWQGRQIRWYERVERMLKLNGRSAPALSFEEITNCPPPQMLSSLARELDPLGLRLQLKPGSISPPLRRQDRTEDPFARISNGADLKEALTQRNMYKI